MDAVVKHLLQRRVGVGRAAGALVQHAACSASDTSCSTLTTVPPASTSARMVCSQSV